MAWSSPLNSKFPHRRYQARMRVDLCQGRVAQRIQGHKCLATAVILAAAPGKILQEIASSYNSVAAMDLVPPPVAVQSCSEVQPLEDYESPRAPLIRQVSLDEERRDDCQGHWRGPYAADEEEEKGVRLFRALLLQHLRTEDLRTPACMMTPANPDPRGWWLYWRDWRSLERAAKRFRETKARARLADIAESIPLLSLDEVEFEDIMQELCQACSHAEHRALLVLAFLCEVCARAVRVGGWCRAVDWAARHVAQCATPWAIRHGGWSAVVERAGATRRDDTTFLAGAAVAALLAFLLFCHKRLRITLL